MTNKNLTFAELRNRAEEMLSERSGDEEKSVDDKFLHLIHELEVYQVEIELQNEELQQAKKELEHSRNRYFDLYHSAPVGLVSVNAEGLVTRANKTAEEMLADSGRPLSGRAFSRLIHSKDHGIYFSCLKKVADRRTAASFDVRLVRENGGVFHVRMEAGPSFDDAGNFSEWRLVLSDITLLKETEEALRRANYHLDRRARELARLASELTLAEHRERRHLAEILHDNLQQVLVAARMKCQSLALRLKDEHKETAESITEFISESIRISRSLTNELFPSFLRHGGGLCAGLEWLVRWMEENHGLTVELKRESDRDLERKDIALLIFQSVRELLFNVVKHAGVRTARIEISEDENNLSLSVIDSGAGFDPEVVRQ